MKRTILILISFLSVLVTTKAQLSFYFLPELYGRSIDGLGTFQVQNLGQEKMTGQISRQPSLSKNGEFKLQTHFLNYLVARSLATG